MTADFSPPHYVAGVCVPRTPVAVAALETARAALPAVVFGHASRVFVFASLAARNRAYACDPETLFVAAMYANMGLSAAYAHSKSRYELDSADAARSFLQYHHAPSAVLDDVWQAIALHLTPGLPSRMSALTHVLSAATRADLIADDLGAFAVSERNAILAAYPRGVAFKERIIEAIGRGIVHRPLSTFGTVSADVLERIDPEYCRLNFCGLILGASWED